MTGLQIITDPISISDTEALLKFSGRLFIRIIIDLLSLYILVKLVYYPVYRQREYFFMFTIFNLIIFLISFLLNKVDISMGAAFGLFAVFSMLRYRTESVAIRDMTYLFLCIAIGLITAVTRIKDTPDSLEYVFLVGVNGTILLITWVLESNRFIKKELSKLVIYENIELIKTNRHEELLNDLKIRTGINVHRYSVQKINFLKDTVLIKVYYYE